MLSRHAVLAALALSVLVSGCKKSGSADDVSAVIRDGGADASKTKAATPEVVQELLGNFGKVRFAYDAYELDDQSKEALKRNADILLTYGNVEVEIEGHADERGSTEYNLALGEKRAEAVRRFLTAAGVGTKRVRTISYGEERPAVQGHDEVAWSENRRAEFRVISGLGVTSSNEPN